MAGRRQSEPVLGYSGSWKSTRYCLRVFAGCWLQRKDRPGRRYPVEPGGSQEHSLAQLRAVQSCLLRNGYDLRLQYTEVGTSRFEYEMNNAWSPRPKQQTLWCFCHV